MAAINHDETDLEIYEEEEDDEKFIIFDIASYPSDLTLSGIHEMWRDEDITIPGFQRNFVWSIKQASLLIESFLMGLPVPQVFFYIDDDNKNLVIDGQQRILSVVQYLDGYFGTESIQGKKQVFRLYGLDDKSPFAKKRFVDLDETEQRKLKRSVLRAINIRQLSPKEENTSMYHIFERLNTGGTPLKPQEIRNCVFRGAFAKKLTELNKNKDWRLILGKETLDRHQKDVELLLRIFALTYYFEDYEKPLKEFLNTIMKKEQSGTSKKVASFEKLFPTIALKIVAELGPRPFHLRNVLNASALDAVVSTLMRHPKSIPENLGFQYLQLKEDASFNDSTVYSTSDKAVVKKRVLAVEQLLVGV